MTYCSWRDADAEPCDESQMAVVYDVLAVLRGAEECAYGYDKDEWMDIIREVDGYSDHVAIDSHTLTAARIRQRIYDVATDKE